LPEIDTVTWTSFAATVGSALSTASVTVTPGWVEWSVKSAVQAAYTAGEPVYLLVQGGTGVADTNRIFASMEHATTAWQPQLVITYTQLTEPPPDGIRISVPGSLRVSSFGGTMK
jgi:hypothetical protein